MIRHIGRLFTALGMLGVTATPLPREEESHNVQPEAAKNFYIERAVAKRARKNAARLEMDERGVMLSVHA